MKENETLVIKSKDEEEWYTYYYVCQSCKTDFMADKPKFCPGCGKKIAGEKSGNVNIYEFSKE